MTIAFITPPGQGGVKDYTDKLVEYLATEQTATAIAWQQDSANAVTKQALCNETLYLQYSGYGYAKRGTPLWLLQQLQSQRPQIKTLGVCFHELYALGPPWGSAFWLSPAQRHIARRLAELSDFWITNREESAQWLRRFAGDKPHAVLPVFSNVGEMPVYFYQRLPKIVVFGGAALRLKTYRAAGDKFFVWAKQQGLEIHDVGSTISDPLWSKRLTAEGVLVHGRLPETEISRLLADAMFGLVVYPVEYVAKSGVFAAYCAHGVCPVLISRQYPSTDGLLQNRHYLAGIPETVWTPSVAADIGLTAWSWYQPHRLASHAVTLNNLLGRGVNNVS
ncbi:MAG: hypothetical protein WCS87_12850 [Methylococcaceae bacterium]